MFLLRVSTVTERFLATKPRFKHLVVSIYPYFEEYLDLVALNKKGIPKGFYPVRYPGYRWF